MHALPENQLTRYSGRLNKAGVGGKEKGSFRIVLNEATEEGTQLVHAFETKGHQRETVKDNSTGNEQEDHRNSRQFWFQTQMRR